MTTVLDSIIEGVREDLAQRQAQVPLDQLIQQAQAAAPALDAYAALAGGRDDAQGVRVIA